MYESKRKTLLATLWEIVRGYIHIRLIMVLFGIATAVSMFAFLFIYLVTGAAQYTIITDPAEYGNYTGSGSDQFAQKYIGSIFPEQIDESFSDIKYSYKAGGYNNYNFEAYLEFVIDDPALFNRYIESIAKNGEWKEFSFDPLFHELTIDNVLDIDIDEPYNAESLYSYSIDQAKIRKILYCAETNTIIYWAMGVYDGGGIGTNFLNAFFERFEIDPAVYVQTADSPYGCDPYYID